MVEFNSATKIENNTNELIESIKYDTDIIDIINTFEKLLKKVKCNKDYHRSIFYRQLLEKIIGQTDIQSLKKICNYIIETIKKNQNNQNKYSIIMDTNILLAIRLHFEQGINNSKLYFQNAISYGEKT